MKIFVKPLSVNEAYRGRRFATSALKNYKAELFYHLPKRLFFGAGKDFPKQGKLAVKYVFGISSQGGDYDNLIKAFQDCLSEKYGFNDNRIYRAEIEKQITKKGKEFIEFEITKK